MAEGIEIKGIPPYDGRYELDASYFLNQEYRILKKVAGIRPMEVAEAFEQRDVELFVALAIIARERAGLTTDLDVLWKAQAGKITFYADEEAEVESPPEIPSPPEEQPSGSTENNGPGGDGTRNGGDASPETSNLHSIGSPSSDISAISGQAI